MMKLESETEVRSKNTPVITAYCLKCRERQRNENLWDYIFKIKRVKRSFMNEAQWS